MLDCLVIGGGPAGLTAAIYLARFHLAVTVLDAGKSRAGTIPLSRNLSGFPEGVSGRDLLARMTRQAELYGARLQQGMVERIEIQPHGFRAYTSEHSLEARTVLLATGVVNRRPTNLDEQDHDRALADGRLRYCPVCDGYEVTDRRIAVLGTGERGYDEAIFLRSFSADITLIAQEHHELDPDQRVCLSAQGIVLGEDCRNIRLVDLAIVCDMADGAQSFDCLYPALGSDIRSELGGLVGAERSDDGCLKVDSHQRTSIPGLFGAGDVVLGLDQISHAMGEGGVAATTIRNDLAKRKPLTR